MQRDDKSEPGDDDLQALLRRTGARIEPPSDVAEEVRRAVRAEWESVTNARKFGRRAVVFGIAASVAAVVLGLVVTLRSISPPQPIAVAILERVAGTVTRHGVDERAAPADAGRVIMTGDHVSTDGEAVAAIRIDRISVRLDSNTTLAVIEPGRLALRSGAIYVDAGPPGSKHQPLEIETAAGRIQHAGTQYQIRAGVGDVTISVREGRVEVAAQGSQHTASAGDQIVISPRGEVVRGTIARHDPSWAWAARIAPPFQIENQPLTAFLQWVARETGRTLVYASPDIEIAAADTTLHGSIANLPPEVALSAVLSTTQFERLPASDPLIRIAPRSRR
jgi:hypothetical protein